jgi:dipeptidyl aminopeptidase/acylaminoacyl peptidase
MMPSKNGATPAKARSAARRAAAKHPVSPEDNYLLRTVHDPQLSPDGSRVAYVVRSNDRDKNERQTSIWVAASDSKRPARRFTSGTKDGSPRWSPDGRYLAFTADRGDKAQIFLAPLDGGEAQQITKTPHGVLEFAWSPDGTRIAYVTRVGEWKDAKDRSPSEKTAPRVIKHLRYRFDTVGYFDERRTHIFVIDVGRSRSVNGAKPEDRIGKQITDGDYFDQQVAWSPDGKLIAFVSDRERERHDRQFAGDVWVVAADGGRARKLTRSRGAANWPLFSPDGRTIAYVGHEHGHAGTAKNSHVLLVPVPRGAAPRSISASVDNTIGGAPTSPAHRWSADGKSIVFLVQERGAVSLYRASVASGRAEKVLGGERQIQQFSLTREGRIAFVAQFTSTPPEVYVTQLGGGAREHNISHANDELLAAVELGSSKRMTHRAKDALEIESFVIYPPGYTAGKRYPLALYIHGGPHAQHPLWGFAMRPQTLAGAGYVVLLPNPRGSTGYGEKFTEMCVRDWAGKDYDDLMGAVDALVRKGVADPERLYVTGYSYGGFMTTWVVGHTDRFKAAIIGAPVANHLSMIGTTEIPVFSRFEVGWPWDDAQAAWDASPLAHLPNCTTPVMIEHHEGDLRCPIGQGEEVFQALKMMKKEVEFVRYPGGFHTLDFHAPAQDVDYQQRQVAWFDGHGGRPAQRTSGTKRQRTKIAVSKNGTSGARPSRRVARRKTAVTV